MATSGLTHRQQILVDLLAGGPRTTHELAVACGHGAGDKRAHDYVRMTLLRLSARGLRVRSIGRKGSHHGCLHVLVAAQQEDRADTTCWRCGAVLATDHSNADVCSPCERSLVDEEIALAVVAS